MIRSKAKKHKLAPLWEGPYVVTGVVGRVNVKVAVKGRDKIYHINLLKKYDGRTSKKLIDFKDCKKSLGNITSNR